MAAVPEVEAISRRYGDVCPRLGATAADGLARPAGWRGPRHDHEVRRPGTGARPRGWAAAVPVREFRGHRPSPAESSRDAMGDRT